MTTRLETSNVRFRTRGDPSGGRRDGQVGLAGSTQRQPAVDQSRLNLGQNRQFALAHHDALVVDGQEPGLEPNLSASLAEAGQETARAVDRAGGDDVIETYEAATAEARKLGVFGSPTFAVGKELFWGDDRLADALCWLRHGRLKP